MISTLQKILESKRALRRELASQPVGEKLRLLDEMQDRESAIRAHVSRADPARALVASRKCPLQ
jgi:hypothetical protein